MNQANLPHLDLSEQATLARLVRQAIERAIRDRKPLDSESIEGGCLACPRLREPRGAFVTIYVGGELRGCLGEIEPRQSLAATAAQCGGRAVYADWRFEPVRREELAALQFKISVLTIPEPVRDLDEVVIGRDGLIVRHEGLSGLLLPEVASERGWNVATFLKNLWRKAGIDRPVRASEVELLRFESQLIRSEDFSAKND